MSGWTLLGLLLASASPSAEVPVLDVAAPLEPEVWGQVDWDPETLFDPAEMARWRRFRTWHRLLSLTALALVLAYYLVLLVTPLGSRLFRACQRLAAALGRRLARAPPLGALNRALARAFGPDYGTAVLYTWALMFGLTVLLLPVDVAGELIARAQGLSNYTPLSWAWDLAKGLALESLGYTTLVFGLFGLVRRFPRRWWLVLGLPAAMTLVAYGLVSPYRARLFDDFRPLEDRALARRLEGLAAEAGFPLSAIKVREASRTTNVLNAYITGMGPSRELVLYDTLLEALTDDEIVVAVAHELAHQQEKDVLVGSLLSGAGLVGLLWLAALALRWGSRCVGHDGPGDPRNLPLLLLTTVLAFTLARPVVYAKSRAEELQADRIALATTQDPASFVSLQVKLARRNQADVRPPWWAVLWFASHPSVYERIATAKFFAAWQASAAAAAGSEAKTEAQTGGSAEAGMTPRRSKR